MVHLPLHLLAQAKARADGHEARLDTVIIFAIVAILVVIELFSAVESIMVLFAGGIAKVGLGEYV